MIDPDLVREIFVKLGEDRWNQLINALYSHNTYSPAFGITTLPEPIKIELDYDTKMKLDNIAGSIYGLQSEVRELNETLKQLLNKT